MELKYLREIVSIRVVFSETVNNIVVIYHIAQGRRNTFLSHKLCTACRVRDFPINNENV